MTENEAIVELKQIRELWLNDDNMYSDTMKVVIDQDCVNAICTAIRAFEEAKQYRAIGTIERFRELTEKAEPKKPIIDDSGHEVYKLCPTCRAHLIGTICCGRCGQRIG